MYFHAESALIPSVLFEGHFPYSADGWTMYDGLIKWPVQVLCLYLECYFQVLVEYEQAVALEPLVGQHLGLQHWSLW